MGAEWSDPSSQVEGCCQVRKGQREFTENPTRLLAKVPKDSISSPSAPKSGSNFGLSPRPDGPGAYHDSECRYGPGKN